MNSKYISVILFSLLFIVSIANFLYIQKHKKARQRILEEATNYINEIDFLERIVRARLHFDESKFPILEDKSIIIYLSGKTCPSCVEQLLHLINEKYNKMAATLFLANRNSQVDFINGFNDAFRLDYTSLHHQLNIFAPRMNQILVLKIDKGKVKCIIEYKPEEERLFEKYFVEFDF